MKGIINKKKFVGIVIVTVVVAFALVIGISVYSVPNNKLSRQIDIGYKYLENGRYEEAIQAFENAISIDEKCVEAYLGGIEAYLMTDDSEALAAFYDRALSTIRNMDDESLRTKAVFAEEIYLAVGRVYSSEFDKKLDILEEGWRLTDSKKIEGELIEGYLSMVEERIAGEDYEGGLEVLDRLLKLVKDDVKVLKTLEKCLSEYINRLMEEEKYEEIQKLAERYEHLRVGIDFDGILKEIEVWGTEGKETKEQESAMAENENIQGEGFSELEYEETTILQSDNWVDDLYHTIMLDDPIPLIEVMTAPDFIGKCEMYPHESNVESMEYRLSTSDGISIQVTKYVNGDHLLIRCENMLLEIELIGDEWMIVV